MIGHNSITNQTFGVACWLIGLCLAVGSVAQAETAEEALKAVLEEGWGDSIKVVRVAEEHFAEAQRLAPGDVRVPLAMAWVQMKHRRYSTAEELIDKALKLDAQSLPAHRAKIFLLTLTKRNSNALTQMTTVAKSFPEIGSPQEAQVTETCRLMGRIFGYLEGPMLNSVGPNLLADAERKLTASLLSTRLEAFAKARLEVSKQFAGLSLDTEQTREEEKVAQKDQKESTSERLAEEKESIEANKAQLEEQASKATQEAQQAVGEIDAKVAPIDAGLTQINVQGAQIRNDLSSVQLDINRALAEAENAFNNEDPIREALWQREANRLRNIRLNLENQYRVLDAQAATLNQQKAALLNQRQAIATRYDAYMKQLGRQSTNLTLTARRVSRDLERNDKPATGNTSKTSNLSTRLIALTTYVEFPLDQERQRLLETLP